MVIIIIVVVGTTEWNFIEEDEDDSQGFGMQKFHSYDFRSWHWFIKLNWIISSPWKSNVIAQQLVKVLMYEELIDFF